MRTFKHTRWPWRLDARTLTVHGADGARVAMPCEGAMPSDEAAANAALIAAAPDLLAALQYLARVAVGPSSPREGNAALTQAKAAIDKATPSLDGPGTT